MKMDIQSIPIKKLVPNTGQIPGLPRNPRLIRDRRFDALKKSLLDDPEMLNIRELIAYPWGKLFVVIGGNMRLEASKEIGLTELPCKVLPTDTPVEKLRAYAIKDNVAFGEDDEDALMEWDELEIGAFGMDFGVETDFDRVTPPGKKAGVPGTDHTDRSSQGSDSLEVIEPANPQYEPTGKKWKGSDLFEPKGRLSPGDLDVVKDEGVRRLLEVRDVLFTDFNFARIADYFVNQATDEEKELFKKLGLVLLDHGDMIKYGFQKIVSKNVENIETNE